MKCEANDCKYNVDGKCFDATNVTINHEFECEHFYPAKKHTCGNCNNRRTPLCNQCLISNSKTLRCIPSNWKAKEDKKK